MPIRRLMLRVPQPRPAYPAKPKTVGEHLNRRRLDQGLTQREVADALGANIATLYTWEKNRKAPGARHLPGILRFLGYDPRSG